MSRGHFTHLELPADDLPRAKAFYAALFGWQIAQPPGFDDYEMFRTGQEGIGGGIGLRGQTAPRQPRIYLTVDSPDEALARVPGLGGSVSVEKTEIPGSGWYAAIIDTEGSEIGLWEDAPA
jgi:predicted enzyme related to lactoylglutathione lyase